MKTLVFESVKQFVGMDYDAYLITINKEEANEMLNASIGNRKLNINNVNALVRDMNENEYYFSVPGSGVAFNKNGKLVNGHHTLTAFIESELDDITLTLTTGASNLDKCDTGKSRTLVDSATMSGFDDVSDIAKLALNILRIKNNRALSNSGSKKEFSNSVIFNFAKDNEVVLGDIYNSIRKYKKERKNDIVTKYSKSEPSVLGAILYEMIYMENNNKENVMNFAFGVLSLSTFDNSVGDDFRKKIINDSTKSNKNGAWSFELFRQNFKNYYKKYNKSLTTNTKKRYSNVA